MNYNEILIIPFASDISHGEPIRTFVSDYDETKYYSFTEHEITMPLIEYNNYVKLHEFSEKKIKALHHKRRKYKNCIYARNARKKRKEQKYKDNCKDKNNTLNTIDIKDLPELIYYKDYIKLDEQDILDK